MFKNKHLKSIFFALLLFFLGLLSLNQALNFPLLFTKIDKGVIIVETDKMIVFSIAENSPAKRAQMKEGEELFSLNNERVSKFDKKVNDLLEAGITKLEIKTLSSGQEKTYTLDLQPPLNHSSGGPTGIETTNLQNINASASEIFLEHLRYTYLGKGIPDVVDIYQKPFIWHNYFFTTLATGLFIALFLIKKK